jgi:hypothetical protein
MNLAQNLGLIEGNGEKLLDLETEIFKSMASKQEVRQYLAYWFQLGKKILIDGGREALLPQPVISGDRYSNQFEAVWQIIISPDSGDCYLEGTGETIADLLSPGWEVSPCGRCSMPVPFRTAGLPPVDCPCSDIPGWPNSEVPLPRSPIDSSSYLQDIRDRLLKKN